MLRYLAYSWDPENAPASTAAQLLRQRAEANLGAQCAMFNQPGLVVFVRPAPRGSGHSILLDADAGVILGTLFDTSGVRVGRAAEPGSMCSGETEKLIQTDGRHLIRNYWGSYVALLRRPSGRKTFVLRGPMSDLSCFHARFREVDLFFSSVEDCVALGLLQLSINWDCIRAQSTYGDYLCHETAVAEISAIECGECLEVTAGRSTRKVYWSPCDIAKSNCIEDFNEASCALAANTQLCIDAWASGHEHILHTLSGGLDSSIVLACLKRAQSRPNITCVTSYTRQSLGDEREFARSMAKHAGVPLIERERSPKVDLRMFLNCSITARPVLGFSACDTYPANIRLARERDATAVSNGELGDNVFGTVTTHDVVCEYVWRHGIRPGLLSVALDFAHLKDLSVWSVLHRGLRDSLGSNRPSRWSTHHYLQKSLKYFASEKSLVSQSALVEYERQLERFIHPWFRDVRGVPQAKYGLIQALFVITSTSYHPPFAAHDDPPMMAPLASQPLVETSLQIASHLNIWDGRNRAVARHAFTDQLPEQVLTRGGKSHAGFWIRDLVAANRALLREVLLDGLLVRQGILDRKKVEAALSGEVSRSDVAIFDVIHKLYIEAWLRRWTEVEARAAA